MRCAECPLSLACWSGHLGVTRARPELCPRCKRFVIAVVPDAGEIYEGVGGLWYALKCEQRPFDRAMNRRWQQLMKKQREEMARTRQQPHVIPHTTEDPVNRLPMGLVLGECVICSGWVARWKGKYIDLDEVAQAAVEDA